MALKNGLNLAPKKSFRLNNDKQFNSIFLGHKEIADFLILHFEHNVTKTSLVSEIKQNQKTIEKNWKMALEEAVRLGEWIFLFILAIFH